MSTFLCDLHAIQGIFAIGGHLPPIDSLRETTAPRALRTFKSGIQVDFGLIYYSVLEFLKLEVICLQRTPRETTAHRAHRSFKGHIPDL